MSGWLVGFSGELTLLKFSREQEHAADESGLLALYNTYGHTAGSAELFEVLAAANGDSPEWASFFSTHPLSDERIAELAKMAAENGWQQSGELTPLPEFLRSP